MIILFLSDIGWLTDDDYTIRSRSVNRWWVYYLYQILVGLQTMSIPFILDLGRLADDDYTKYIRSRSVNRWYDDYTMYIRFR